LKVSIESNKMNKYKASIVIPTKNAGKQFERVLNAVLAQKAPWPFEVLVVDSGSSDNTVEYCKKKGVRVHEIPSVDFGHGKTRNLGISLTSGEFAVMITHDALPFNDSWLNELVDVAESSEDIAGVFGRHYAYEESGLLVRRDLLAHFDGFKNMESIMWNEDPERYNIDIGYRQLLHFFSDNNACLRRSVWKMIPYPEVDFAEDQLWAKLIIESGYKKAYADKAAVFHSHSYSIVQTFRRSFDESRALKRLFGYSLCESLGNGVKQVVNCTLNDLRYLLKEGGAIKNIRLILKVPFLLLAKQVGYYLGDSGIAERRVGDFISLDSSLKKQ
jgi:rhamnosyltransferase